MIKNIITLINLPRLLLHIFFFLIFKNRCIDDVRGAVLANPYLRGSTYVWGGNILLFCKLIVFNHYFRNIFYRRIGFYKYLIQFLAPPHPSFVLGTYTCFGKGIVATHPFSTIINAQKVGKNLHIKNNITIGNNNGGIPIIGDNVTIGVNTVIVGDIRIGNNVVIGTCSLIMHNVPDNCTVVGNPAYIVKINGEKCKILLKNSATK